MNNSLADISFTRKIPTQVKWLFVLLVIPLYMYCGSLIITAFLKFIIITFSLDLDLNAINAYLNLIFDLGMLILLWWMLKDTMKQQWIDFKKDIKQNMIYSLVLGTVLLYVASFIGGIITLALGGGVSSENQQAISQIVQSYPIVMIITTVIFAPILEEMIFRGIVFGWLYEFHPKLAHILSGFLFGFMHIMTAVLAGSFSEWTQIFSYFFMGVVLSFLYEKRNNIYVPIGAHILNNLISIVLIMMH